MWTLLDALQLVRAIQPELKPLQWHVALGGGVLNIGQSDKDLDLYVLGFNGNGLEPTSPVTELLVSKWGYYQPIANSDGYPPDPRYREKIKFTVGGKRIDVFIQ